MSAHYELVVDKDMRLLAYDRRLKANRELKRLIGKHGLTFRHKVNATRAAEAISGNPLVARIIVTLVVETNMGVWRNGKKF